MKTRTDIHRPSALVPEDYEFVACHYLGAPDDPFEALANVDAKRIIRAHMVLTGDRYSGHQHGGTCHICGATAMYLAVYYHPKSRTYIQTGEDCATKMALGDVEAFNPLRRAIANAKAAKAGKMKARAILEEIGLARVWELAKADDDTLVEAGAADQRGKYVEIIEPARILRDIVWKLEKYGSISEAQESLLRRLLDQISRRREIEAERAAEKEAADPCPTGRVAVEGKVLKTEVRDGAYGESYKMTVKTVGGFLVWGTVPGCLEIFEDREGHQRGLRRGDHVAFTATLTPSDRDPKFGFFKRPSKARLAKGGAA